MTIFDAILLIILAGFVFYGLFFGLIRTVGNLAGIIVGVFIAGRFYIPVFYWAEELFFGYDNLGKIITFIVLFTIVNRIVGLVFALIDKSFGLISIIPFLKTINRLGGAALGFIMGGLVLGLILYVASRYVVVDYFIGSWIANSKLAPFLVKFAAVLTPLFPEMLKKLKSVI
jgi:membrane protein required for colicin V production